MKLSKYFTKDEMKCKGTGCCGGSYPMGAEFLLMLDLLRDHVGGPIYVNSGFRCRTYNNTLPDSALYSKHCLGIAADIRSETVSLEYLKEIAEELGFYTILYPTFVHVDGRLFK